MEYIKDYNLYMIYENIEKISDTVPYLTGHRIVPCSDTVRKYQVRYRTHPELHVGIERSDMMSVTCIH